LLILIFLVISNKKNSNYKKQLKIQMILYIIEVLIITSLLSYIFTSIEEGTFNLNNWKTKKNDFQVLERFIFSLTAYQGIRYLILKLKDGADYDSFISLKYALDSIIIMIESGIELSNEMIDELHDKITNPSQMYNDKTRELGLQAHGYLIRYQKGEMEKNEIIYVLKKLARDLEHGANITNLIWMNSIFLRKTK
jgi:hypothetical protein